MTAAVPAPASSPDDAYETATAALGAALAAARQERDELAAQGGPEAVAAWAARPGGPGETQIATTYRTLQARSLTRRPATPPGVT